MKTLTILAVTFLLTFSVFAERSDKRGWKGKHKGDHSSRYEQMKEVDDDISKLSKADLKKLENEFSSFQNDQHKKKLEFENSVFELRQKHLKNNKARALKHIEEVGALKKKLKFGQRDANKAIRQQIKEKSKAFRSEMKKLRHEQQRGEIKKLKKAFYEQMKEERKKFKEKIKSYRNK